jgi:signal transduction histidine kinase
VWYALVLATVLLLFAAAISGVLYFSALSPIDSLCDPGRGDYGRTALLCSRWIAATKRIDVSGDAHLFLRGDPLLVRQALLNVLHNATKYSPLGGRIAVWAGALGPEWIAIRISDTGPGIAPEHRVKIFDRFYRIDEARTREAGGSGLGLAIASWSIQVQGGQIQVEDSEQGAAFLIRLPVH